MLGSVIVCATSLYSILLYRCRNIDIFTDIVFHYRKYDDDVQAMREKLIACLCETVFASYMQMKVEVCI